MDLRQIDDILVSLSEDELNAVAGSVVSNALMNRTTQIRKLELMVTEDCQFRCDYCFVHGKNDKKMDKTTALSAVDMLLHEAVGAKNIEITFFGGEPLLEFELICEVVSYVEGKLSQDQSVTWAITTNGALLDDAKMQFFQNHGLNLLLSIDGNRETQDAHRRLKSGGSTFDLVCPQIPLIKKYQGWIGARVTVNPDTTAHVLENVKFLREAGINQFIVGPNMDVMWSNEAFDIFKEQYYALANYYVSEWKQGHGFRMTIFEKGLNELASRSAVWGCEAGRDKICVSPTGEIYPCTKFEALRELTGRYRLGDLTSGITEQLYCFELEDARGNIRGKCLSCDYKDYCTGGCPADNLDKTGSIYVPYEMDCKFHRLYIDLHVKIPDLSFAHQPKERPSGVSNCME